MRHFAATLIEEHGMELDERFYTADELADLRKWLEYTYTLFEQYVRKQAGGNE